MYLVKQARVRGTAGFTSSTGGLGHVPEGEQDPPSLPGNLGPCMKPRGVYQLSLETQAWVRVPLGSTSSAGHLTLVSEGP